MAQTVARTRFGPETYEAGAAVTGGQLVKFGSGGTAGKVIPTGGTGDQWLGVALYDAQPAGTTGATTTWGFATVDASVPQPNVAVAWHGVFKLQASEALNAGDVVYPSATAGQVQKTTATGRAVGQVVEPLGILSGAFGLVRLF
jgi:hypothetical protein